VHHALNEIFFLDNTNAAAAAIFTSLISGRTIQRQSLHHIFQRGESTLSDGISVNLRVVGMMHWDNEP